MEIKELILNNIPENSAVDVDFTADEEKIVIRLSGSLDLRSSGALQNLLVTIIARMDLGIRLVVDLQNVSYIPSAGVGALTLALSSAKKRDIRFQLRHIQPKVRSVFELLGFMSFFEEAKNDD